MPEGTKKLGQQLTLLLEAAEALNTASNNINTILHAVEEQLIKANIGLEVWLTGPTQVLSRSDVQRTDQNGTRYTDVEAGFTKLHDGWHLAARHISVEEGPLDQDGDPIWTTSSCERDPYPIAQASRKERIAALRVLPDLIHTLRMEATQAIKTIEEAQNLIVC
jgi:hypothetical protein